jgi:hypothetical protein
MTNQALVPADISDRYEVHEWRNGLAILTAAHPKELIDILIMVDNIERAAPRHKIDCYKNRQLGRGSSYGCPKTHVAKLHPRPEDGSGNGRPLVVFKT